MNQQCIQCNAVNHDNARFCHECGATLGATMVEQRTVIASSPMKPFNASEEQIKTCIQNVQNSIGTGQVTICQNTPPMARSGQSEATFFIIDVSGSMGWDYDGTMTKLDATIRACITMVLDKAKIDPHDEIGLICFDTAGTCILNLCPISSHKPQILRAIQSLRIMGGTDINSGLVMANQQFDWNRQGWVNRIILLTDGQGGHPLTTAQELKAKGVVIDVIGVGDHPENVDEKLLRKVASFIEGEERYRFIKDSQTLVKTFTQLAAKTAVR